MNESSQQAKQPHRDQISALAYQLWEQRGRPHGCDVVIWLEAEQKLASAKAEPPPPKQGSGARLQPPEQRGGKKASATGDGGNGKGITLPLVSAGNNARSAARLK